MKTTAAIAYAGLAAMPMLMHLALAAGAPLGHLTVGGKFPGTLPPLWRGLAVAQAGLLVFMALAMLSRAGVVALALPGWSFWLACAITALTFVANVASPSQPEQLLWGPVTGLMALTALIVAVR